MNGKETLTHIDLFSGIGGFALAAAWAGFRTIAFCEIDPFCQEVLKARFGAIADTDASGLQGVNEGQAGAGESETSVGLRGRDGRPALIPDIRDFDGTRFRGATLLTGGFPCQPFSHAGRRRGQEDDRYLWPEMLRVIAESRPRWVVAENVPGLISIQNGVVFEQVCADLENEGYAVQAFIIPACAKNAPHRRDRVWIVGHSNERDGRGFLQGTKWETVGIKQSDSDAPDAEGNGQRAGLCKGGPGKEWWGRPPDPWGTPWIEVATRLCRVDDGLPAWVYRHRVARLKALGNAIVPQVAYEIIKEIVKESKNEPQ